MPDNHTLQEALEGFSLLPLYLFFNSPAQFNGKSFGFLRKSE